MLSRELGHGRGTNIRRGILRQEIDDGHLNHWMLAEVSAWSKTLPQTQSHGLKAQRGCCCCLGDIHSCNVSSLLGPQPAFTGRKPEALWGRVQPWDLNPKLSAPQQVLFLHINTLACLFFPALPCCLLVWISPLFPSAPAHPVRLSLNLILSVIGFLKHFS